MDVHYDQAILAPALDAVERRRWLFANLPLDPMHERWIRQRAWVRTVHGSTRIEGNTLSDLEVDRLLDSLGGKSLPRKDALEVLGTRSALELVDELATRPDVALDQSTIREIHRRVLGGQSDLLTPGEYRRGENRVGGADGEIVFTTPPSGDVPELMRALTAWLADHADVPAPAPMIVFEDVVAAAVEPALSPTNVLLAPVVSTFPAKFPSNVFAVPVVNKFPA